MYVQMKYQLQHLPSLRPHNFQWSISPDPLLYHRTLNYRNYTSTNGSKRGLCNVAGTAPGVCALKPPDALKGDFARIYFYMAVRYEGEFDCCLEAAVDGADIAEWQETMLKQWHAADPVDLSERERNERVFGIQKNRNPFVDYPAFVDRIADFERLPPLKSRHALTTPGTLALRHRCTCLWRPANSAGPDANHRAQRSLRYCGADAGRSRRER